MSKSLWRTSIELCQRRHSVTHTHAKRAAVWLPKSATRNKEPQFGKQARIWTFTNTLSTLQDIRMCYERHGQRSSLKDCARGTTWSTKKIRVTFAEGEVVIIRGNEKNHCHWELGIFEKLITRKLRRNYEKSQNYVQESHFWRCLYNTYIHRSCLVIEWETYATLNWIPKWRYSGQEMPQRQHRVWLIMKRNFQDLYNELLTLFRWITF